jgi:DNA-binding phage protein
MDFERIASEWLRFIRGKRSQRGFSRRLGYRSNIAYRWESGVCFPTAAETFALVLRGSGGARQSLESFYGSGAAPIATAALATREGIAALLSDLRGKVSVVELARRSGFSRFAIARWLSGAAEPRLPEFLALLEAETFRSLDFLSVFAQPAKLPCIAEAWRAREAARELAYEFPWSHAVLRALELTEYRALPKHRAGWLARRLGISRAEEKRCLDALLAARQVRFEAGRYVLDETHNVDTRSDPARARALKAEWLRVALKRFEAGVQGVFGYNLMAVSLEDLERLRALHIDYFRKMQALVADSSPSECVVLFNTELFALDAHAHGAIR